MMDNRIYRPSSVPDEINQEKLQAEVALLGDVGVSIMSDGLVFSVYDDVTDVQIQAVIDAHDASIKTDSQVEREELQTFFSREAVSAKIAEMISLRDDIVTEVTADTTGLADRIAVLNAQIATISATVVDLVFTAEIKAERLADLRWKRDTLINVRGSKLAIRDILNNQLLIIRMLRETA